MGGIGLSRIEANINVESIYTGQDMVGKLFHSASLINHLV